MKTSKIRKVLVAVDYDPTAQKVAEAAYSMAKAMNAEVTLLHVISDPIFYSSPEYSPIMGLTDSMGSLGLLRLDSIEELKKVSQHFLDKFKLHLGDEAIQTIIVEGDYAEVILNTAKKIHADVIVMGSHSRKWLENIVMGSVTREVLNNTTIPLFIIPTKKRD